MNPEALGNFSTKSNLALFFFLSFFLSLANMKEYLSLQGASREARMLIKSLSETFVNFNSFRNVSGVEEGGRCNFTD